MGTFSGNATFPFSILSPFNGDQVLTPSRIAKRMSRMLFLLKVYKMAEKNHGDTPIHLI